MTHRASPLLTKAGGLNEIDTLQAIDSIGTGTVALYFTITNSSTVSTPPAALLPALQTSAGLPHLEQPSNERYESNRARTREA